MSEKLPSLDDFTESELPSVEDYLKEEETVELPSVEEFVEESFPNYQVYGGEGSRQELSFDTPVTTKKRKDPDGGHARGNTNRGKRKIIKDLEEAKTFRDDAEKKNKTYKTKRTRWLQKF